MTDLNWKTASEDDAARVLLADANATSRVLGEAEMHATFARGRHPAHNQVLAEYEGFRRRLTTTTTGGRLILALEMRDHFAARRREAEAHEEAERRAHFDANLQERNRQLRVAQQEQWARENTAQAREALEEIRRAVAVAEAALWQAVDPAAVKAVLDDLDGALTTARTGSLAELRRGPKGITKPATREAA